MSKKKAVSRAILPSKAPKENSSLLPPVLVAISVPWFPWLLTPITSISVPSSCHLLFCMSVSSLPSLVRTFFTGIKAHQGNLGWLHLKFLNYICKESFSEYSHIHWFRMEATVQQTDYTWPCWGKWWRGHNCQLAQKLGPGNWRLLFPLPSSLEYTFFPHYYWRSWFQGHSFERVRCCWDHLDRIHDWTPLGCLYKTLGFWQAGAEIYSSCSHPRQASYVSSFDH